MGSLCLVLISIGVFQTVLVKGINWLDVIAKASESSSFIYCTIKGLYITIVTYIYTMFPNLSILMLLFFTYAYFGCWNAAGLRAGLLHGVIRSFHAWNYLTGGQALAWGCRSRFLRWKTQAWFKVLIYIIYLIDFFINPKNTLHPIILHRPRSTICQVSKVETHFGHEPCRSLQSGSGLHDYLLNGRVPVAFEGRDVFHSVAGRCWAACSCQSLRFP